ncbi:PROTEIN DETOXIFICATION [Salix viminalis]|uniref:Protein DETOXIFICATION n=1 Tax=Salix viminalis TaxID=40686 RepID=A0A9Q0QBP2_SALVM|nr:PROTEIN DETOXIFICATION [Salix viminalis]
MCQLSSPSLSCKSKLDPKTKVQESDRLVTALIPKDPTFENPQKTHLCLAISEARCIANIALPMILTGLLLYSRSMISMIFLGRQGELALAGGSLAIGFANITGYSILSGLSMGMEPICGQAFGARKIQTSWPRLAENNSLAFSKAQLYILYSLPDLLAQSILHPLRLYLRSQSITLPLTFCASLSILLHVPINYLLVSVFNLGIKGVALSAVWTNFNLVGSLIIYVMISGVFRKTWGGISSECLKGWRSLLSLAIPSCISVCLEWWWYEIMILLCGLLLNPRATVASMGILIQTTAFIYIFPSSLSFGVSTRVGNELGANNPQKAKLAATIGLSSSFVLGFAALCFAVMVRKIWASMFTQDEDIIALTSMVLPIIGLCELGNCPQTTGCGVLRGTARPKMGANINLGCFYLVGMPVAVWLSFYAGFDFKGLWLGLLAAQGSCVVTMLIVLARTDWECQAQRAKELIGNVSDDADHNEEDEKLKDTKNSSSSLDGNDSLV